MKRKYINNIPLYFILILSPLFVQIDFFLYGITAEFICILPLILCGTILLLKNDTFHFNRLDLIFLLFVLWYAGVNIFISPLVDQWSLIRWLGFLLLYFYCRNIQLGKQFFILLFWAGLLQAFWSILQRYDLLSTYHNTFKATGCFFNPAILGIFLVMSVLSGMVLWSGELKLSLKLLYITGFIILLACIFISDSRASWFALLIGSSWLFFSKNIRRLKISCSKGRLLKYLLFLFLGLSIICGILLSFYYIRPDSVQGRFLIWQVIGSKFLESSGLGQGHLQALYMSAQAAWFQAHPDSELIKVAGNNVYAFNEFLRIALESGIVGLLLFICLVITSGYYALTGNTLSRDSGSLLIAVLCFGLFSYPFSIGLIVMISLIVLSFLVLNAPVLNRIKFTANVFYESIVIFLACLFLFFIVYEYSQEKRADLLLVKARHNPSVLTEEAMLYSYGRLRGKADFVLCYGKNLYENGLYREALPVLEQGFRLKPSSELCCDLGMCYQYLKDFNLAESTYSLAASMTPAYIVPQYRLFCLYQDMGDLEQARTKANYILTMPVKVVNTSVLRVRNQARKFLENCDVMIDPDAKQ